MARKLLCVQLCVLVCMLSASVSFGSPVFFTETWEGYDDGDYADGPDYTPYDNGAGLGSYVTSNYAKNGSKSLRLESIWYTLNHYAINVDNAPRSGVQVFSTWMMKDAGASTVWGGIRAYASGTVVFSWDYLSDQGKITFAAAESAAGARTTVNVTDLEYDTWYRLETVIDFADLSVVGSVYDATGSQLGSSVSLYYAGTTNRKLEQFRMYNRRNSGAGNEPWEYYDDFSLTAIPEPATLVLFAVGSIAMVRKQRRS